MSPTNRTAAPVLKSKKRLSPRKPNKATLLRLIIGLVILAAIGTAAYYVDRYQDSQAEVKRLSNPTEAAKDEQQKLISRVSQLVQLPQGETPTVATVTDASKLKDQVFFAKAQNGDKVLIYTEAKQAIMYRPSTNKIINIAPVNLGNNQ